MNRVGAKYGWRSYVRRRPISPALAIAKPYGESGVRIVVFYDRVESLLQLHPRITIGAIFGHVLAHEIAHVLQGIARHSEMGVMRAGWTEEDFMLMGIAGLTFTPEDIVLILRGFTPLDTKAHCTDRQNDRL